MSSSVGRAPAPHLGPVHGAVREVGDATIVDRVRGRARLRPEAVAVEDGGGTVTFADLWRRVLLIAAGFEELGVGPGDRVVIHAGRTTGTVVSALAVMALRAVYVPVDPARPTERLASIIAAAAPTVVTHDGTQDGADPAPPVGRPAAGERGTEGRG